MYGSHYTFIRLLLYYRINMSHIYPQHSSITLIKYQVIVHLLLLLFIIIIIIQVADIVQLLWLVMAA